jgi:hypothetical protein
MLNIFVLCGYVKYCKCKYVSASPNHNKVHVLPSLVVVGLD